MARLLNVSLLLMVAALVAGDDGPKGVEGADGASNNIINELQDQLALSRSNLNLATTNLKLARDELDEERAARMQDMASLNRTVQQLRTTVSKFSSVAFHATLESDPLMVYGDYVKFTTVQLNIGGGYDPSTGVFTVPSGGAGLYFINLHLITQYKEFSRFQLRRDSDVLCVADGDNDSGVHDHDTITCAATVQLNEGDKVFVRLDDSTSNHPLFAFNQRPYQGFTGYLLRPL